MNLKRHILIIGFALVANSSSAENIHCDNKELRESVLTKVGYAPTDQSYVEISKYCKWQDWIKAQLLNPKLYNDNHIENDIKEFEIINKNNLQMMQKYSTEAPPTEKYIQQELFTHRINYTLYSENRLREMMVWFWFNHFNVYGDSGAIRYVKSYEDIFRNNPFGNFKDILLEVTTHPSMLIYLDNDLNTKPMKLEENFIGYNDNHARELLELHSMGVDGGYTEEDIAALAKILTGFKSIEKYDFFLDDNLNKYKSSFKSIKDINGLKTFFNKNKKFNVTKVNYNYSLFFNIGHTLGEKKLLGNTIYENKEQELTKAIEIITKHPATAKFISKKLYAYFLGTDYNQSLLNEMENTFKTSNGDIKSVLEILLTSKDFENNLKIYKYFKNPFEFIMSATKLTVNNEKIIDNSDIRSIFHNLSFGLHSKLTPEGYSLDSTKYESSNILHQYINFSDYLTTEKIFGIQNAFKNNYYKLNKNEYFKFLISEKMIYK